MMRHNNRPGYSFLDWFQLAIGGKLFQLGRLQYEIFCGFEGNAYVFRNMNGEEIALAHNLALHQSGIALGSKHFEDDTNSWIANVKETSNSWDGYPLDERGMVRNEIISLCNFTNVTRQKYCIGVPKAGTYRVVFSSASPEFGGKGESTVGSVKAKKKPMHGYDYSIELDIEGLSCMFIKNTSRKKTNK